MIRYLPALVLLVFASCKGSRELPVASAETPIFIISVDTLRSDRLPMYGYTAVKTPHFDALRADGILYEQAYSHTPLTLPSHSSLLTGLLPGEHGVRDNLGYQLDPKIRTVQEMLRERGYATGAAISAFVLRKETGMNRGFDFYDDGVEALAGRVRMISNIQRDGAETAKVATEWIGKQQKPVFFMLHIYEPHTPYSPPEPFKSSTASAYDGEIAYADSIVGGFIASLKEKGLYDKAMIVLLSDHGEGLNDHGEEEHGMFLYREAIQVPLVVKLPGNRFAGDKVGVPVQIADVMPTILERTGIAVPAGLPGRSLVSFLGQSSPERRKIYSETYYPRFHFGWADQHSLIDGERHYIHSPKPQLFNVAEDPGEKKDILTGDRRGYFAMREAIEPLIRQAEAPAAVDPEDAAKLAALGYLGSTVQTKPGEVLPDPKDQIPTFQRIGRAFVLFRDKKYPESLELTQELLTENPRILDLYDLKSKVLTKLGRIDEAIENARAGLRLSPNAMNLAFDASELMLEQKQLDDAQKHAELGMKSDPARAHEILSRIWIERKDLAKAEAEAKLSMQSDGDKVAPLLTLARVQREQGKLDAALVTLDQALAKKKEAQEVVMLHFLRGDVYARLGRGEEAEREFRREIELFPEDPPAYKNLILLLVAEGRIGEGTALIRQLIEKAPTPPSYVAVCHVLETLGDKRGVRYWARQGLARYPGDPTLRRLAG